MTCDALRLAIIERMKETRTSQHQLSKRTGYSPGRISELVNGKRNITPQHLNRILAALGVRDREHFHRLGARQAGWRIDP